MGRLWSGAMGQGGSVAVEEDDSDVMVAGFVTKDKAQNSKLDV